MGIFDKVNESQIVGKTPVVASTDPDLAVFLNPSKVLVVDGGKIRTQYGTTNPYIDGSGLFSAFTKTDEKGSASEELTKESPDVPDLSDIELVKNEKYWDTAKKQERARLVIKVKNNSKYKTEVVGIDARIYNPAEEK